MMEQKNIKAVLWDLDDTLYSRIDAARKTFPGMFKENLYPNGDDTFINKAVEYMMTKVKRNSMIHEDAFNALLEKYPSDIPYVCSACLDYYYNYFSLHVTPFDEQLEIIKRLRKAGIKNAIVTNISEDRVYSQRKKIDALGISHLFDAIVISGEIGIHKPDRRIYDHTAKLLGVENRQCIFVGDDPDSDISGAINAGMESVWLDRYPYSGLFENEPSVHRVASVGEFFTENFFNRIEVTV